VTGASESDSISYRVAILIILVTKIDKLTTKEQRKLVNYRLIYVPVPPRWQSW
jgi:GTP-binding protein EngB required for normal cell division